MKKLPSIDSPANYQCKRLIIHIAMSVLFFKAFTLLTIPFMTVMTTWKMEHLRPTIVNDSKKNGHDLADASNTSPTTWSKITLGQRYAIIQDQLIYSSHVIYFMTNHIPLVDDLYWAGLHTGRFFNRSKSVHLG